MKKLTKEQHRGIHIKLHKAIDELFADYIQHHPAQTNFIQMQVIDLITWAYEQTKNPTE